MIEEANPDWRLLSWLLALVVVASRSSRCPQPAVLAGRGICVPGLLPARGGAVAGAIRERGHPGADSRRAFAAVEIAGWIGVGAYQIGNIIELHNGFVGVDEACSGVKTLQASIMVALVLGELFQLRARAPRRSALAGCAWVFVCNVLRATTLVIIAARQGTEALSSWHDPIGIAVLIVGMAGLMAFGVAAA